MTDSQSDARAIFCAALDLQSPSEQDAYIAGACGDDAALKQRVQILLDAHRDAGSFLAEVNPESTAADLSPITEGPGTQIGPYKLREQIGEGGMGVVFVAEQREPIERKVALKIIRPGLDTREVIARFQAERQALALMNHPNIAKVLDAGTTAGGRPYFVMELVQGIPITAYCDRYRLTTQRRLRLFIDVCSAVQHAHQKGVIHRDLKPSNVLVTEHDGRPVVKVIDFGVAKAINQKLTEQTIYTRFQQVVGTPMYMSPEQADVSGLDIDTRSDVYALGVLLYELVTGTTPFDREHFKKAAYEEIRRIVREVEPSKPSTKVGSLGGEAKSVSDLRQTDPQRLSQSLRGEVDWIAMKALDKDRNRRYQTASSFAEDVERYLSDQPVDARPPSTVYRAGKFVRRNRTAVAVAGVVLLSLVAGVIGTTIQWRQAEQARGQAENLLRISKVTSLAAYSRAFQDEWPVRSVLLGIAAVGLSKRNGGDILPIAHEALLNATVALPGMPLTAGHVNVTWVQISPDDRWVIVSTKDFKTHIWDLRDLTAPALELEDADYCQMTSDGRWLYARNGATGQNMIRVWDLSADDPTASYSEIDGLPPFDSFSLSVDRRWLFTGGKDDVVRRYDLAATDPAKSPVEMQCRLQEPIQNLQVSPDGRFLCASQWRGSNVEIWDLSKGDIRGSSWLYPFGARWIRFGPNGRQLFLGGKLAIHVLNMTAADPTAAPTILNSNIRGSGLSDAAVSGDARWLVTAADNLQLWDLSDEDANQSFDVLRGHGGFVRMARLTPDGNRLVTGGADSTVRVWDLESKEQPSSEHVVLRGHEGSVDLGAISSDGRWVVTARSDGGAARLWDLNSFDASRSSLVLRGTRQGNFELPTHHSRIRNMSISGNARWLVTAGEDSSLRLWDLQQPNPAASGRDLNGHVGRVHMAAISRDARWLISGGQDKEARLWDLTDKNGDIPSRLLRGHTDEIEAVAISPDNKWAVTGSWDGTARLWELAAKDSAGAAFVLPGRGGQAAAFVTVFSPNSRWLAVASKSRVNRHHVYLLDLTAEDPTAAPFILQDHRPGSSIYDMQFTSDNALLVTAGSSGKVLLWDVTTNRPTLSRTVEVFGEDEGPKWIHKFAISSNQRWLAVIVSTHALELFDLRSQNPPVILPYGAWAASVAISADNRWLAVGSKHTALLWDLESSGIRGSRRVLRGHHGNLWTILFTPDNRYLVTGGDGGNAILWPLDMDELLNRARRAAGRELTVEERAQFGLDNGNE